MKYADIRSSDEPHPGSHKGHTGRRKVLGTMGMVYKQQVDLRSPIEHSLRRFQVGSSHPTLRPSLKKNRNRALCARFFSFSHRNKIPDNSKPENSPDLDVSKIRSDPTGPHKTSTGTPPWGGLHLHRSTTHIRARNVLGHPTLGGR